MRALCNILATQVLCTQHMDSKGFWDPVPTRTSDKKNEHYKLKDVIIEFEGLTCKCPNAFWACGSAMEASKST